MEEVKQYNKKEEKSVESKGKRRRWWEVTGRGLKVKMAVGGGKFWDRGAHVRLAKVAWT